MTAFDTVTQWADLAAFKARMTANYLLMRAQHAAAIAADPEAWKERFWTIYGQLATTKALLMVSRARIQQSPNMPGAGNILLGINQAEAAVDVVIGTIKANLTDARTSEPPKTETGWVPVVLAIAGLGITVAAILWALAYERDAQAALTYADTVNRETARMSAEEAANVLAKANPGTGGPETPPNPAASGSGTLLVAGAVGLGLAGAAAWWFTSGRRK